MVKGVVLAVGILILTACGPVKAKSQPNFAICSTPIGQVAGPFASYNGVFVRIEGGDKVALIPTQDCILVTGE